MQNNRQNRKSHSQSKMCLSFQSSVHAFFCKLIAKNLLLERLNSHLALKVATTSRCNVNCVILNTELKRKIQEILLSLMHNYKVIARRFFSFLHTGCLHRPVNVNHEKLKYVKTKGTFVDFNVRLYSRQQMDTKFKRLKMQVSKPWLGDLKDDVYNATSF